MIEITHEDGTKESMSPESAFLFAFSKLKAAKDRIAELEKQNAALVASALQANPEPRPSNDLLWEAFQEAKSVDYLAFGHLVAKQAKEKNREQFEKWIATLPPDPLAADTKDLMDLGKSIAKTQELLMGMNEPRPSNDLLWEAWWASAKNWGAEHVLESEVRPRFQEWIASIEVDPYEDQDEDLQSPAWCIDCSKMIPFLEDSFALLGFHPTLGHCVIASNYGFTQVRDGRFSVVSYASEPREFMDSKSAADWCAAEKVWFIPPHGNHRPTTQSDPLAADKAAIQTEFANGLERKLIDAYCTGDAIAAIKRFAGMEVDNG